MGAGRQIVVVLALIMMGCAAPSGQSNASSAGGASTATTAQSVNTRTLIVATDTQVDGFGPMFFGGKSGPEELEDMVQRSLADIDDKGDYFPSVAVQLPSLDDGTWQVLADGRSDMTWKLRPDARWHDGSPLTSDDILFSWQVATALDVPYKVRTAVRLMDGIDVIDAQTFVIHWNSFYVPGDRLVGDDLFLLPKHILDDSFTNDRSGFVNSTYWSSAFVGLGPFKLTGWVPGSSADVEAFDGFFGDAPHIHAITFKIIPDIDTAIATILAGGVDVWLGSSLGIQHAVLLNDQWESKGGGQVLYYPRLIFEIRLAPGDARVADPRMREALYDSIDRQGIVRDLYDGLVQVADSYIIPGSDGFETIDAQTIKYPYDPNRALALLADQGITKGPDGQLHSVQGDVFTLPFSTTSDNQERDTVQATVASMWSSLGFDVSIQNVPLSVQSDPSYDYSTTDLSGIGADFESNMPRIDSRNLRTAQNPRGADQWGYVNPNVDRLLDQWGQTADHTQQIEIEAEVMHQLSQDLPILPINYRDETITQARGVSGLLGRTAATDATNTWNVEQWTLASQ